MTFLKVNKVGDLYKCSYGCQNMSKFFKWQLILSIAIEDQSGQLWATVFKDVAESLIGKTAEEMGLLREKSYSDYLSVLDKILNKTLNFHLRGKSEFFKVTQINNQFKIVIYFSFCMFRDPAE